VVTKIVSNVVRFAYFIAGCGWLVWRLLQERISGHESSLPKLIDLCKAEMEQRWKQRDLHLQLKSLFPQGHRDVTKLYIEYCKAKMFTNKMKKASLLLHTLDKLDQLRICEDLQSFLLRFEAELRAAIKAKAEAKAKNKKITDGDVMADLHSIPEKWMLKEYFSQLIEESRQGEEKGDESAGETPQCGNPSGLSSDLGSC
jgi:hypothetical protein